MKGLRHSQHPTKQKSEPPKREDKKTPTTTLQPNPSNSVTTKPIPTATHHRDQPQQMNPSFLFTHQPFKTPPKTAPHSPPVTPLKHPKGSPVDKKASPQFFGSSNTTETPPFQDHLCSLSQNSKGSPEQQNPNAVKKTESPSTPPTNCKPAALNLHLSPRNTKNNPIEQTAA